MGVLGVVGGMAGCDLFPAGVEQLLAAGNNIRAEIATAAILANAVLCTGVSFEYRVNHAWGDSITYSIGLTEALECDAKR